MTSIGIRERAHKINTLYIKCITINSGILRHFKVMRYITWVLTTITRLNIPMSVLNKGDPEKPRLKSFPSRFVCTIMPSCRPAWHCPKIFHPSSREMHYDLICTYLEKIWILPHIVLYISKDFLLLMICYVIREYPTSVLREMNRLSPYPIAQWVRVL